MNRIRVVLAFLTLLIFLLTSGAPGQAAPSSTLRVSFINVGQGDSILLHDGNNYDVLVDGGQPSAGPIVVACLRQQNINDVDVMVATQADSDHIGGRINVLEMTDIPVLSVFYNGYPGTTATWNSFVAAVNQEGLALAPLQYPTTVTWGSMTTSMLNPDAGFSNPVQNDASVALLISHGNIKFLPVGAKLTYKPKFCSISRP